MLWIFSFFFFSGGCECVCVFMCMLCVPEFNTICPPHLLSALFLIIFLFIHTMYCEYSSHSPDSSQLLPHLLTHWASYSLSLLKTKQTNKTVESGLCWLTTPGAWACLVSGVWLRQPSPCFLRQGLSPPSLPSTGITGGCATRGFFTQALSMANT